MSGGTHAEWRLLVQADVDGELDAAQAASLAGHLAACAECRALRADLVALSGRLRARLPRHDAPRALRRSIEAMAAAVPETTARRVRPRAWYAGAWYAGAAAAAAGALALVLLVLLPPGSAPDPALALVSSHVRALQPGHLTDVLSSDKHTVRPWFAGKLPFAPPVRDLAAEGFPLLGGRLDALDGRAVAALVFQHDKHLIDLYIAPATKAAEAAATSREGYNIVSWSEGGMRFDAVSDVEAPELARFVALWRAAATTPGG
jgi:anti-sigma factor RsiW